MSHDTFRDEEILTDAQAKGPLATLFACLRLSGPGWLQSAITLGGGSLAGALYLGMLSGTSMLWLQLIAILIGLVMLMAISYVTMTSGMRPYAAINEHINPVLGVGWLTATILANMIFILGQFSLCYTAVNDSIMPDLATRVSGQDPRVVVTAVVAFAALVLTLISFKPGATFRLVDLFIKLVVGLVVLCFVAVVWVLATDGALNWQEIAMGFIPDFSQWNNPSGDLQAMLVDMDGGVRQLYEDELVKNQRKVIIGVTATAVGLNMTFLLPYSLIQRGWSTPAFRGISRMELILALAIPYLLVTTCIVIASAHAFHGNADKEFLSNDPGIVQQSPLFKDVVPVLEKRYRQANENDEDAMAELALALEKDQQETEASDKKVTAHKQRLLCGFAAELPEDERKLALSLVRPNAGQLAATLQPVLERITGDPNAARMIFGIGALAMGFSTIYILMLINGYAFAEMFGNFESVPYRAIGAILALAAGVSWIWLWGTGSETWLIIMAGTFGGILLPIAYFAFFLMMNNRRLLGEYKPTGVRMSIWNLLMLIALAGAVAQSYGSVINLTESKSPIAVQSAPYILGGIGSFLLLLAIGFSARFRR